MVQRCNTHRTRCIPRRHALISNEGINAWFRTTTHLLFGSILAKRTASQRQHALGAGLRRRSANEREKARERAKTQRKAGAYTSACRSPLSLATGLRQLPQLDNVAERSGLILPPEGQVAMRSLWKVAAPRPQRGQKTKKGEKGPFPGGPFAGGCSVSL